MKTILRFAIMLTLTAALCLCLSVAVYAEGTVTASGTCGENGNNLTWTLYDTGELVIKGTGKMASYSGYSEGAAPWYTDRLSITSVTVQDGVTSVGWYAFTDCSSLTSVTIPGGVTSIGNGAFQGCNSLTIVILPDSVTGIGGGAFEGCSSLMSVTIPESVTSIGYCAFYCCSSLTSVTIPESVTSIGFGAFYCCSSLTSIIVDDANQAYCDLDGVLFNKSETEINCYPAGRVGEYAIPKGVTSIGNDAFFGCSNLTSVTIPEDVTSIGEHAFCGCSSLTSATIPDSVTSIGDWAFRDCSSLTGVTIPDIVTSIGPDTFSGCSGLTSVTIPEGVTNIGGYAFNDCSKLTDVYYGGSEAQWELISIGSGNNPLTSATIHYITPDFILPADLTTLEAEAFYGDAFTYVLVPEGVEAIGSGAFANCPNLQYVEFAGSDTLISDDAFGSRTDFTIIASAGSAAATWANQHGVNFIPAA